MQNRILDITVDGESTFSIDLKAVAFVSKMDFEGKPSINVVLKKVKLPVVLSYGGNFAQVGRDNVYGFLVKRWSNYRNGV